MSAEFSLESFAVSPTHGFLPETDPLLSLPAPFAAWDRCAAELPKMFASDMLRSRVESLPPFPTAKLHDAAELERAMLILSYIGHAYVWGADPAATTIPYVLARPWCDVAARLGRPPVLSYASYALFNWRRLDPSRPPVLGNIALVQNFLGGIDEEWFILIHVDIEYLAAEALKQLQPAQRAAADGDVAAVSTALGVIGGALERMYNSLARMPENCDPYIYYNRVRPYIHGWKDNPALPNGLVYEGVDELGGVGQKLRGETGAQSSIIPCIDAVLGIEHKEGPLKKHLQEMRQYMPPKHRAFMEAIEQGPSVRELAKKSAAAHPQLRENYNRCVTWVEKFRGKHLEYAASYIQRQKETGAANPTQIGTGGTPFMSYLSDHRVTTSEFLI